MHMKTETFWRTDVESKGGRVFPQAWPTSSSAPSGTPGVPRATATPQGAGHDAARPTSLLPPQGVRTHSPAPHFP